MAEFNIQPSTISLEDVTPDPSLERHRYHLLSLEQLEQLDDPESNFERGFRLLEGIGVPVGDKIGLEHILCAARFGHPLALAVRMSLFFSILAMR